MKGFYSITLLIVGFMSGLALETDITTLETGVLNEVDGLAAFGILKTKVPKDKLFLLKVQIPGCSACATLQPKLKELAKEYPQVTMLAVNYMNCWPELLDYQLTHVPTCIFLINGVEVNRVMTTQKAVVLSGILDSLELLDQNVTVTSIE